MYIRGIILAAGTSTRMGKNKLQMDMGGNSIIQKVIQNARNSELDELLIVYGRYDVDTDVPKIFNKDFEQGMSTSVKCGFQNPQGSKSFNGDAVMLILGDMPFADKEIINALYEGFEKSTRNIAVPIYDGKRGNPVIIGQKYFKCLMNNTGDKGARDIIRNNPDDVEKIEAKGEGIFIDIDDEETYKKYYNLLKNNINKQ